MNPHDVLTKMGFSEAEAEVYLAMLGGALTARDIVQTTGRSRPTVYYVLSVLEQRGLLSKTGAGDEHRFRVEPVSRLTTVIRDKQDALASLEQDVGQFVKQFGRKQTGDSNPEVAFYEGVAAVSAIIMESLYNHSRHIDSLVPAENFFWQLGEDFVRKYVETRQRLGLSTRNIWAKAPDKSLIKRYYDRSDVRILPSEMGKKFRTTVFLYDDKVLYVSSLASGYALVVHSTEHHEFMGTMFEMAWAASQPAA